MPATSPTGTSASSTTTSAPSSIGRAKYSAASAVTGLTVGALIASVGTAGASTWARKPGGSVGPWRMLRSSPAASTLPSAASSTTSRSCRFCRTTCASSRLRCCSDCSGSGCSRSASGPASPASSMSMPMKLRLIAASAPAMKRVSRASAWLRASACRLCSRLAAVSSTATTNRLARPHSTHSRRRLPVMDSGAVTA